MINNASKSKKSESSSSSSSSSDEEDDEKMKQFREAAVSVDTILKSQPTTTTTTATTSGTSKHSITDGVFTSTSTFSYSLSSKIDADKRSTTKLQSKRNSHRTFDENDSSNELNVTPDFQDFVARKLKKSLDE